MCFFTISGILIPFLSSVPLKNGGFKTLSSQNDLYKLIDNFYDPDQFYDFRNNANNMNILATFYNQMNSSKDFDLLTSFDQAVVVIDFKGDDTFYYNSEEFLESRNSPDANIKALQLNKKAYCFYNIEISSGAEISWENISYTDNHIPILLGSEYKNYYRIGDIIDGSFYNKAMEFEVIGFLKNNCTIKYGNISDLCLDTYMLIPYPPALWKVNGHFQFESILYFAMINCDIVPFVNETQILKDIKEIANQTGFSEFSLVGIDNFQIEHIDLLIFVQDHHILFILSLIIMFIFISIVGCKIFCIIIKYIFLLFSKDHKKFIYWKIFVCHIIMPYGIAFLFGLLLSVFFLKKILLISIFLEAAILLITYIFLYIAGRKYLSRI